MKVRTRGIEQVVEYVKSLPRGMKIEAMRAAAEYFIGDDNHGLKHYPARVNHGEDNPYKWTSEKQRKKVMAMLREDNNLPYQRTNELSDGWTYTETNSDWTRVNIENTTEYGQYVMGDSLQIGHKADGWRYYLDVIKTNISGAIRAAQQAVDRLIKSKG